MGNENAGRESLTSVQITVFNQTYRVTSSDNGERALRVAQFVDSRMRETAAHITTHDVARIAVLTVLQVADELLTLKEMREREQEVSAAPDAGSGSNAPGGDGDSSPTTAQGTWFESVFNSELAQPDSRAKGMGSRLSERLRTARQPEAESDTGGGAPKMDDLAPGTSPKNSGSEDGAGVVKQKGSSNEGEGGGPS